MSEKTQNSKKQNYSSSTTQVHQSDQAKSFQMRLEYLENLGRALDAVSSELKGMIHLTKQIASDQGIELNYEENEVQES